MYFQSMRAAMLVSAAVAAFVSPYARAEKSEQVDAAYKRLADFLKAQNAFRVDMTIEYTLTADDQSEWAATEYTLAFVRPDRLSLHVKDSRVEAQFYVDGGNLITFVPALNQYTVEPAKNSPLEIVMRSSVGPVADAMVIFGQTILSEPFESPLRNAVNTTYGGEVELAGVPYERVNIDLSAVSWDAWITKSDPPTLYRVVPKMPGVEYELAQDSGKHIEIDVVMDFENWTFDAAEVEKSFIFEQAATAEHVAQFAAPESAEAAAGPEAALVGKAAPLFELSALDGSAFNLENEIGEHIVVLDFWATWCGPCREAMPVIEKVTKELASEGVRLYAVNLEEEPDQITAFLEQNNIDVNVLLDKTSTVAAAYHVDGIPQTVVIGKDGVVAAVHVGVSPDLEQKLRAELTGLIEGKSAPSTD